MLHVTYSDEGRTLKIGNRNIQIPDFCRIYDVAAFDDRAVVILDVYDCPYDFPNRARNVVAFDAEGNLLWRIEPMKVTFTGRDGKEHAYPYSELGKGRDGTLWAASPVGFAWQVDLATGHTSNPIQIDK